MPDLASTKIKRKIYRFEIKRRYTYEGHYRIKERPPIERIKDALRSFTAPKKEEKRAVVASAPPPGGFNFLVMGAAIAVALIILLLAGLYLAVQAVPSAGAFQPEIDRGVINATVDHGEILTLGDRITPSHVASVFVNYDTANLQNLTVQLTAYDQRIPSEVFVLVSDRSEETKSYPDFVRILRSDLATRQILLNEITIQQLATLPEGAMVIVPSGVVPEGLLGVDSPVTMDSLASKGVIVIYIGQPFTYMLNGSLSVLTPQDTLNSLPVSFDESADISSTPDFHLKQPLYRVSALGGWTANMIYGSVSVLEKGDGAFIFVPQTLDSGWDNATVAADDIATMVFDTPWITPDGDPSSYVFTNQTQYSGSRYFFTNTFTPANATIKVEFIGYPLVSSNPVRETVLLRAESMTSNALVVEQSGQVIPYNVTGQPTRMNARLREPIAAQPDMFLNIFDVNGTEAESVPEGNINVQSDESFDPHIDVDRGEYIVRLMDDSGKVYAQTYMDVVSPDIQYAGEDQQKQSLYNFNIELAGQPYTLSDLSVSVDEGQYGTFKFNNVNSIQVDVTNTGGQSLPYGNHSFSFTAGDYKTVIYVPHTRAQTLFDNPLFWLVGIFTVGIVGIGVFFARQEDVFFSIDIPDFPPVARTRIPLSPDVVISIFTKINDTYRWQNTPLTANEVKNGFKDIFFQGKPIIITDYNVEYLLDDLEKKGRVKEALGYYGLSEWADKTKRSMDYMALMRRLRDICVNNAIPFTGLGESEEADSVITVVGQQMFVHFFDKSSDVSQIIGSSLSTISKGITIILFKNNSEKEAFQNMLVSSPSAAPMITKMEAEGGSLQFLTAEEFEKMLMEFKSM